MFGELYAMPRLVFCAPYLYPITEVHLGRSLKSKNRPDLPHSTLLTTSSCFGCLVIIPSRSMLGTRRNKLSSLGLGGPALNAWDNRIYTYRVDISHIVSCFWVDCGLREKVKLLAVSLFYRVSRFLVTHQEVEDKSWVFLVEKDGYYLYF